MSEQQQIDTLTPIRARKAPLTASQREIAQMLFLTSLKSDGNVTAACEKAGISRETAYNWRDKYKVFGSAWDEAQKRFDDRIRAAIVQRGVEGYEEPVVSMGQHVYEYEPVLDEEGNQVFDKKGKPVLRPVKPLMMRKYSDTLLLALARSRMPEFREKQQVELSGRDGGPLLIQTEWGNKMIELEEAE